MPAIAANAARLRPCSSDLPPGFTLGCNASKEETSAMSLVDDLVPHMRRVQLAERDLHDLGQLWQMIEAASAISCPSEVEGILPTLTRTRAQFTELQARLVRQLGQETLAQLSDELASSAQCTIDILV